MEAAIEQQRQFFKAKREDLYQIEIFYAIVLEGSRSKTGIRLLLLSFYEIPPARLVN